MKWKLAPALSMITALCCALVIFGFEHQGGATRPQGAPKAAVTALPMPEGGTSNVELSSVSCVDSHFCIAVGAFLPAAIWMNDQGEQPVILRFDGKKWSMVQTPSVTKANLDGVDCVSRTSCVAVGESLNTEGETSTLIYEMRGRVWSVDPAPNPDIYSVNSNQLQAVSCVAIENCTAVGSDSGIGYGRGFEPSAGIVEEQTPTGWTLGLLAPLVLRPEPAAGVGVVIPTNALDPTYLSSISCMPRFCVSAGEPQRSFIEQDGGPWTAITNSPMITNAVTCAASRYCLEVGSDGAGLSHHTLIPTTTSIVELSGTRWQRVPSPNTQSSPNTLNSVACVTTDSCVAVGTFLGPPVDQQSKQQGGIIVEIESNGTWYLATVPKTPADLDDTLSSVSCPSSHACVAVGDSVVNVERMPSGPVRSYAVLVQH